MSSKGIDPHLYRESSRTGIAGWIGRLLMVFAALVATIIVFNFWIMPVLVRKSSPEAGSKSTLSWKYPAA